MFRNHSLLALIPARSGSKGLPDKNITNCAGKPLIEWSILAAKKVKFFDDVVVSTDSEKIADIATHAGASVPFLRPNKLAKDESSVIDVANHAWSNHLRPNGERFDYIVLLLPTSPLRTSGQLISAIEHYFKKRKTDEDTLVSVYEVDKHNHWIMQQHENGYIGFCLDDVQTKNPRRQELKPLFRPNGVVYICKGTEIDEGFYPKAQNIIPFVMGDSDSQDIDNYDDLRKAENLLIQRANSKHRLKE